MTAPARLLALRLQGFKSFAERTLVEFGPGISAVVGPNGSGKSQPGRRAPLGARRAGPVAPDAQVGGRHLGGLGQAARRSGWPTSRSSSTTPTACCRSTTASLEIGRRLFRSGENDYLLNKQRVRLRDLVDLLDGANLADNAFLFIGQGMVDQALALRPEERRPLFEEVAGVRRPERRRRKAEEQLTESEANLARVEDILAELRPQARRLAAQAEQQATRATAGDGAGRGPRRSRPTPAGSRPAARLAAAATGRRERAAAEADTATAGLQAAEAVATQLGAELESHAAAERARARRHEAARVP